MVGASGELRLPFRLGIELDILRRPVGYEFGALTTSRVEGSFWEFPLLVKYRVRPGLVTPFVAGGVAWNRVSVDGDQGTLARASVAGTPLAGGLEGCFGPFCLTGEIHCAVRSLWSHNNIYIMLYFGIILHGLALL